MANDSLFFFRILSLGGFLVMLLVGVYLFRNHRKLFRVESGGTNETEGSLSYARMVVFAVWAHGLALFGLAAMNLH